MSSAVAFAVGLSWLIVIIVGWLYFRMRNRNRQIRQRLEILEQAVEQNKRAPVPAPEKESPAELSVGLAAPDFELPGLSGQLRKLSQWRGRRVLLVFFDPDCSFCMELAPRLHSISPDGTKGRPMLLVVTTGDAEKNRQWISEYGIHCPVLLQENMEVALKYHVPGTPTGYLIDEQGLIASEIAMGMHAVLALSEPTEQTAISQGERVETESQIEQQNEEENKDKVHKGSGSLAKSRIARDGLAQGTPAPGFRLPRLDAGELSLEQYAGQKVLLIFSDPECGPCDLLAPQLEKLARRAPDIQVIMVSRGDMEANRLKVVEHGLTFPVVLQKQWEISRLYAMFATPIAYLIDEQGIIAANVAAGPSAILNLLISAAILSLLDAKRAATHETMEIQQPELDEATLSH